MPRKSFTKINASKDQLLELYFGQNLSHVQIAEQLGSSSSSVRRAFQKYNIKSRTNAESQTSINITRTPNLSNEQKQLIYGSLLGDACLSRSVMESNKTGKEIEIYKLFFYHTEKYIGYIEHKADLLGIGIKTKKRCKLSTRISGHGSIMKGFAFSHTPTLKEIAKDCLDENYKKKLSTKWLGQIDIQGLAYWFMDDGSLRLDRSSRMASIIFYTQSFTMAENQLLKNLLESFGFRSRIDKDPNGDENRRILVIGHQKDVMDFLRKTERFVVPCMDYKNRILRNNWETIDDYSRTRN